MPAVSKPVSPLDCDCDWPWSPDWGKDSKPPLLEAVRPPCCWPDCDWLELLLELLLLEEDEEELLLELELLDELAVGIPGEPGELEEEALGILGELGELDDEDGLGMLGELGELDDEELGILGILLLLEEEELLWQAASATTLNPSNKWALARFTRDSAVGLNLCVELDLCFSNIVFISLLLITCITDGNRQPGWLESAEMKARNRIRTNYPPPSTPSGQPF